jgi:porphobilinogen synthase
VDETVRQVEKDLKKGLASVLLFGVPDVDAKCPDASYCCDHAGVIPQAVRALKKAFGSDLIVMTDVCLCGYTSHGHCGLVDDEGVVQNDQTLPILAEMALRHAEAGADVAAPSDMMDGRVAAIRNALDNNGCQQTPILSYASKFASAFYGPFRDAADSAPQFGDRKTYQMDGANLREAMREIELDLGEGADMILMKPAMPYLDVVRAARERFDVPIGAYQVSGEYAMLQAAFEKGWLDHDRVILESLMGIRRAGAGFIITYFAKEAAKLLG